MKRLGLRMPAPVGFSYTADAAAALIGQDSSIAGEINGVTWKATGVIVECRVLDDEMGNALWVVVEEEMAPLLPLSYADTLDLLTRSAEQAYDRRQAEEPPTSPG